MLNLAAGVLMLILPGVYWATRPAAGRPMRPWQVLYVEQARRGGPPTAIDRFFLVAWVVVAVVAVLRGASAL